MTVTIRHYTAPSADYDWSATTATDILPLIQTDELEPWILACNGNAGNTNKQLSLLKGYADNTGTTRGWVMSCGHGDGTNAFIWSVLWNVAGTSGNLMAYRLLDDGDWTDDGSNNGYGNYSNLVDSDTSISWYNDNSDTSFLIAYSSDVNQEFFLIGWYHEAGAITSFADFFMLSKDQNDRWFWVGCDSTASVGVYQQAVYNLIPLEVVDSARDGNLLAHPVFRLSDTNIPTFGGASGDKVDVACTPAHPQIWCVGTADLGYGGWLTNSTDNYYGTSYYFMVVEAD